LILLAFYEVVQHELLAEAKAIKRRGKYGGSLTRVDLDHPAVLLSRHAVLEEADHIFRGDPVILQKGNPRVTNISFGHGVTM
jgi:hypothetical protein